MVKEGEGEIHWTNSRALCEDNLKEKRGGKIKRRDRREGGREGDGGFYRIGDKVVTVS